MHRLLACAVLVFTVAGCSTVYSPPERSDGSTPVPPRCAACPGDIASTGAAGRDGAPGRDGASGRDGMTGPAGPRGLAGADGRAGADGSRGPAGSPGRDGEKGRDGERGAAGRDGRDGRDGKDGKDGRDGAPGVAGPPGESGLSQSLERQLERLLGRRDAACDCTQRPVVEVPKDDQGWFRLFLSFLAGLGGFITACTPALLALLKLWADRRTLRATEKETPAMPWWIGLAMIGALIAGGLFFTYLIYSFAIAVLVFICAFMLSASVMVVALAHAYRTVNASMLERELAADARARALEEKEERKKQDEKKA